MWDHSMHYAVIRGRDQRYDGQFFTCVITTGIYSRPSCPARTPAAHNVEFVRTAAQAQQAGYRACRRCHPDSAPGSPEWNLRSDVAARAMRLIDDGVVDREGVEGLAVRLGYSSRQMSRIVTEQVGVGPLAVAIAYRLHHARALLESTSMPVATVAYAAGFGSVRQLNESARKAWGLTPLQVRGRSRHQRDRSEGVTRVDLRLNYREPAAMHGVLTFLAARQVDRVESVSADAYVRSMRLPYGLAMVRARPQGRHLDVEIALGDPRDLASAVARIRDVFDLDADPVPMNERLGSDSMLAPLVALEPGMRLPGAVDGFEVAVRAIVGQQISVVGARRTLGVIAERWGEAVNIQGEQWRLFPPPDALADVSPEVGILPAARWKSIRHLAQQLLSGDIDLGPGADRDQARKDLLDIPGIGPWTAEYILMRALRDADAFPATDLVLRKVTGMTSRELQERAESWRPWRAYAAMHLWAAAAKGQLP